jgi:hypothetical protein
MQIARTRVDATGDFAGLCDDEETRGFALKVMDLRDLLEPFLGRTPCRWPTALRLTQTMTFQVLCTIQGVYFALTGLWPLVHMPSFMRVTGPKTDRWLVRTVGALALAIGLALLVASRKEPHDATASIGVLSAIAFLLVDVVYVAKRTIGPVYLLDAGTEALLFAGWAAWVFGH